MLIQVKIVLNIFLLGLFSCSISFSDTSYITENISFYNKSANIKIAGTLTYPKGKGPFPTVILIPGSGDTNRDGSDNMINRPFFEIANYLTANGMAVLRCDKRGVGESEGVLDFTTTLADLVSDIKASIDFLNNNPIVDKKHFGLIGHSYGGLVAAKVAEDLPSISFIVLLASPGIKQGNIVSQQLSDIPKIFGVSDKTTDKFQIIIDSTMILMSSKENSKIQTEKIEKMYERQIKQVTNNEIETMKKIGYVFQREAHLYSRMTMMPFWHEFYTLDPKTIYAQLKCPVLSVIGENDLQVRPSPNQEAIEMALKEGNNEKYTIMTMKGLNHLFQKSKSGSPIEYNRNLETMSKSFLDKIYNWIFKQPDT
ncbi:MAG TPA: alpha/beta hydrolase [Saprospirales bacterium]|nr:alpha/beta hydrolase [Saprospirales bacterium]HAY71264.1 alpha/beta hydrolase [Saprospirales bacterium]HRQ28546.1 alpha/beta hydrolase [Saprospiraceae bacterium]